MMMRAVASLGGFGLVALIACASNEEGDGSMELATTPTSSDSSGPGPVPSSSSESTAPGPVAVAPSDNGNPTAPTLPSSPPPPPVSSPVTSEPSGVPSVPPFPASGGSGGTLSVSPSPSGGSANQPEPGGSVGGAAPSTGGAGGASGDPITPEGEVLFSDDFESGSVGQAPEGWDTFVGWVANGQNPQGSNSALVSSDRATSGSRSVRFSGGSNPAQIVRTLPGGTNKVYLTAWVWMTRQLGENPGDNHEHIFAIRGEAGSASNEVRFGEIKGVIGTNEVPSDNIAPLMDRWGMGPAIAANTWICYEVAFLGDRAQHELHAWADGELVHSITAPDQWQNGVMPANWLDGKFLQAVFGWHSFSSNEIEVWMDDVVVSTGRRGCPSR